MAGLDEQLASIRQTELNIERAQVELDAIPAKQKELRERIKTLRQEKAEMTAALRNELPEGVVRKRKAATA